MLAHLTKNQFAKFISSEGALYVILPYDYPAAAARPLFEHTPVNFAIDAMMTLVTMIYIMTKKLKMNSTFL